MPEATVYAALLAAQTEVNRLMPGSEAWLEAAGWAQEAWAALEAGCLEETLAEAGSGTDPSPRGQSSF